MKFLPLQVESVCGFFSRSAVPAICQDDAADVPEQRGNVSQGRSSSDLRVYLPAVTFDEREREEIPNSWGNNGTLSARAVEDGFQPCQALFDPTRQMQSYYGSPPAAKRFE